MGALSSPSTKEPKQKANKCIHLIEEFITDPQDIISEFTAIKSLYYPELFNIDKVHVDIADKETNFGKLLDRRVRGLSPETIHPILPLFFLQVYFILTDSLVNQLHPHDL